MQQRFSPVPVPAAGFEGVHLSKPPTCVTASMGPRPGNPHPTQFSMDRYRSLTLPERIDHLYSLLSLDMTHPELPRALKSLFLTCPTASSRHSLLSALMQTFTTSLACSAPPSSSQPSPFTSPTSAPLLSDPVCCLLPLVLYMIKTCGMMNMDVSESMKVLIDIARERGGREEAIEIGRMGGILYIGGETQDKGQGTGREGIEGEAKEGGSGQVERGAVGQTAAEDLQAGLGSLEDSLEKNEEKPEVEAVIEENKSAKSEGAPAISIENEAKNEKNSDIGKSKSSVALPENSVSKNQELLLSSISSIYI